MSVAVAAEDAASAAADTAAVATAVVVAETAVVAVETVAVVVVAAEAAEAEVVTNNGSLGTVEAPAYARTVITVRACAGAFS